MTRLADDLEILAVTAWVGALWAIGLIASPTLFDALPDRALAGLVAGRLFLYVAVLGLGCGGYLVLARLVRYGGQALRMPFFWVGLLMLLLVGIGEFAVQPILDALEGQDLMRQGMESVLRNRFADWYGLPSALYLVECGLGVALALLRDQ